MPIIDKIDNLLFLHGSDVRTRTPAQLLFAFCVFQKMTLRSAQNGCLIRFQLRVDDFMNDLLIMVIQGKF